MSTPEDALGRLSLGQNDGDLAPAKPKSKTAHIFPFFKLPRELRDKIYAEATEEAWVPLARMKHLIDKDITFSVILESAPCRHVSLVSRQFKQEYEKQMAVPSKEAGFICNWKDLSFFPDPPKRLISPGLEKALARVQQFTLAHNHKRIVGVSSDDDEDLFRRLERLSAFLRLMPSIKHLEFMFIDLITEFEEGFHGFYRPEDFQDLNVRQFICQGGHECLGPDVQITCSVVLRYSLFFPLPGHCYQSDMAFHPWNRIVYRAPPTLNPRSLDWHALEVDMSETKSYEDVLEDVRSDECRRELGLKPQRLREWRAGHRLKVAREDIED